jgi:hypothetical protein
MRDISFFRAKYIIRFSRVFIGDKRSRGQRYIGIFISLCGHNPTILHFKIVCRSKEYIFCIVRKMLEAKNAPRILRKSFIWTSWPMHLLLNCVMCTQTLHRGADNEQVKYQNTALPSSLTGERYQYQYQFHV